ncbi:hypothetical protein FRC04_002654 [Tulasnella sp. 424]|nr:hypothetical protein FRC04_002654 [Tulasnella sp. 424]KAG8974164.1 hypothetical protein FRC05_007740 [Tulasnella sp. 425]
MTFAALVWTINTWRKNRDASLWEIAKEKSIFHIMGLCATSLFCAAFFLTAPQPLSSIVPSVSSTMFSVFGCRIAIEMPDYSNCDLLRNLPRADYELDDIDESRRRKTRPDDIESANGSSKGDRFSEVSNLDIIKPVGGAGSNHGGPTATAITTGALDISPLSQAATLVPVPTMEIRGGEGSRAVQPTGEFRSSEVTLSSNEAQPVEQAATKTPAESRRSTLVGGATLKSSTNERPPFQVVPILDSVTLEPEARDARPGPMTTSPAVKTSAAPTRQNQQEGDEVDDDFDELDQKLAEEYDEQGRRRPPRRTHQRQWKSEAFSGLPPMLSGQGFLIPRASSPLTGGRPASAIYYSSPRPMVFPLEPSAAPSGSQSPSSSSRRRSADRSVSPRSRMSLFFHRHHRNDVGSVAVPEGEVPSSFAVSPSPVTENPTAQSPIRRHSTSSSAKSSARGRMRRLLLSGSSSPSSPPPTSSATPLPPQLPSSPSTPSPIASARQSSGRRRDSDAMTICSVSTGFAFDNSGTYEAPDFN